MTSVIDIVLALTAIGLILAALALLQFLLVAVRNRWIARWPCPRCGQKLGATAVSESGDYYERRYGAGVRVLDGPRRYRGARVVKCRACQAEWVFGELGGFVEAFEATEAKGGCERESRIYGAGACLCAGLATWLFVNSRWPVVAWVL